MGFGQHPSSKIPPPFFHLPASPNCRRPKNRGFPIYGAVMGQSGMHPTKMSESLCPHHWYASTCEGLCACTEMSTHTQQRTHIVRYEEPLRQIIRSLHHTEERPKHIIQKAQNSVHERCGSKRRSVAKRYPCWLWQVCLRVCSIHPYTKQCSTAGLGNGSSVKASATLKCLRRRLIRPLKTL